jgi:hypothetical protein
LQDCKLLVTGSYNGSDNFKTTSNVLRPSEKGRHTNCLIGKLLVTGSYNGSDNFNSVEMTFKKE